jgi:hypothetical protein
MGDYSYSTFENGWLHMRDLHCHDFPLLLWDALMQTCYEHGLQRCEVYVDISSHAVFPDGSLWSTWVIGNDMNDAMEKATHMALTALCSQNLPATASMPISPYPIQDRSDSEWKPRMDAVSNIFQDHYHSGWVYMVSYTQHLFQLQHDTQHIVVE